MSENETRDDGLTLTDAATVSDGGVKEIPDVIRRVSGQCQITGTDKCPGESEQLAPPLSALIDEIEKIRADLLHHEVGGDWADGCVTCARETLMATQSMLSRAMYVRGQQ